MENRADAAGAKDVRHRKRIFDRRTIMKNYWSIVGAVCMGLMLTAVGCGDNPVDETAESVQSAEDNAIAEGEFADVFEYVDDEAVNSAAFGKAAGVSELRPQCAVVTVDTLARSLTIDFGDQNCLCKDGLYRRGRIIAHFTGKYGQIGSSVSVTLEEYYVQDKHVTGTKTITRTGPASWDVMVANASITGTDGKTASWSSQRSVARTEGEGTLTPWDDVYEYTGTASGTNANGVDYTANITEPLVKKVSIGCLKTFVEGVLTIANENGGTMMLDYDPTGGAPCDRTAKVTINGKARTITLR